MRGKGGATGRPRGEGYTLGIFARGGDAASEMAELGKGRTAMFERA
jgi:hypothetical protein